MRRMWAGCLVVVGLAMAPQVFAADVVAENRAPATAPLTLTGFRSATFGMAEAAVRAAVAKDFPAQVATLAREINPMEQTTALSVTIHDLVPESGPARVVYILGYRSKSLVEVKISWGLGVDAEATAVTLVNTARIIGSYLKTAGYKPDTLVTDAALTDGSFLVFRGSDEAGHMTVLRLLGQTEKDAKTVNFTPKALQLSYIADPKAPDVFRLDKGKF